MIAILSDHIDVVLSLHPEDRKLVDRYLKLKERDARVDDWTQRVSAVSDGLQQTAEQNPAPTD